MSVTQTQNETPVAASAGVSTLFTVDLVKKETINRYSYLLLEKTVKKEKQEKQKKQKKHHTKNECVIIIIAKERRDGRKVPL